MPIQSPRTSAGQFSSRLITLPQRSYEDTTHNMGIPASSRLLPDNAKPVDRRPGAIDGKAMTHFGRVSAPPPLPVGIARRVMITDRETWLLPEDAVTTMVFDPIASGTFEMVQIHVEPTVEAAATPNAPPLEDQVTDMAAEPPEAEPVR